MTWNELGGCQIDVPNIDHSKFFEVFAIDGGSTDGTREYLENAGINVFQQRKKGLNAAYVDANFHAKGDAVVVFFPKATTPVADAVTVAESLRDYDFVIASRQIRGSKNEEDGQLLKPRKWAVRGLAIVTALLWKRNRGPIIIDVLHGFKGWRREVFAEMEILDHGLSIDIEMVVRGYKRGIKMVEIPTIEIKRPFGESHFKFWSTGIKLLEYLRFEFSRDRQ
jgi:glycosyltransferase involved in cell wall biosynthesis